VTATRHEEAVLASERRWSVRQGNSLALLREPPDACVDAVITDPPYSSGGAFRGDRMRSTSEKYVRTSTIAKRAGFSGDNRDQRGYLAWAALWSGECLRVAKPGAPICVFSDWRQLPTTTDALQAGGWVWRGIVPWDKTEGCRPAMGRFSAQCEYVVWGSSGPMAAERGVGCLPGLVREFPNPSEKLHMAGKTPATMAPIVRICAPGGVILDPFLGGASTAIAALRGGHRIIGFEIDRDIAETARARLELEDLGLKPQDDPRQVGMFGTQEGGS